MKKIKVEEAWEQYKQGNTKQTPRQISVLDCYERCILSNDSIGLATINKHLDALQSIYDLVSPNPLNRTEK